MLIETIKVKINFREMLTLQSLSFLAVKKTHGDNLSPPLQRLIHSLNKPVLNEILSPFAAWYLNTYLPDILDTIIDQRTASLAREIVVNNLNTIESVLLYEHWCYLEKAGLPNPSWHNIFITALNYNLDPLCDQNPLGFIDPIEGSEVLRGRPFSFFNFLRLNYNAYRNL